MTDEVKLSSKNKYMNENNDQLPRGIRILITLGKIIGIGLAILLLFEILNLI
ncbi:MAG: hypothetical protein RL638_863 [Bacteroidota bacterium]|jgi:hypothetical protein